MIDLVTAFIYFLLFFIRYFVCSETGGKSPCIVDETADRDEAKRLYGVKLADRSAVNGVDALVIAVAHEEFADLDRETIDAFFNPANGKKVLVDVKGILDRKHYQDESYIYWRL